MIACSNLSYLQEQLPCKSITILLSIDEKFRSERKRWNNVRSKFLFFIYSLVLITILLSLLGEHTKVTIFYSKVVFFISQMSYFYPKSQFLLSQICQFYLNHETVNPLSLQSSYNSFQHHCKVVQTTHR